MLPESTPPGLGLLELRLAQSLPVHLLPAIRRRGDHTMMTNHGNRVTQGQFSYLPDLTDKQITAISE